MTLNDILQSRSVKELAQTAKAKAPVTSHREEKAGEGFDLSPVQKLYMQSTDSYKGAARFNQSITVRVSRRVEGEVLRRAIRAVTSQHSMFRARFSKNHSGNWQQKAEIVSFQKLVPGSVILTLRLGCRYFFPFPNALCERHSGYGPQDRRQSVMLRSPKWTDLCRRPVQSS